MKRLNEAANAELLLLADGAPLCFLKADAVVARARDETSALHSFFEWDDSEAAEKYRLSQASGLIRMAVTVLPGSNEPIRALVSLSTDQTHGGGYRRIKDVMNDPQQRAVLLQGALAELRMIERKYKHLQELAELWPTLNAIERKTSRRQKPDSRAAA